MTDDRARNLVPIAEFKSAAEASIARGRLEEAGIAACLEGEESSTTLWAVGIVGVKLFVAAEDAARAMEVLVQDDAAPGEPWVCPQCQADIEGSFDVCWSCGRSRFDTGPVSPPDEEPTHPCPMCGHEVGSEAWACPNCGERLRRDVPPGRLAETVPVPDHEDWPEETADVAITEDNQPPLSREADETLRRAWRAAIFGVGLCPPLLNIYSATQLGQYQRLIADTGQAKPWRFWGAFGVNAVMIVGTPLWILLAIHILRG